MSDPSRPDVRQDEANAVTFLLAVIIVTMTLYHG